MTSTASNQIPPAPNQPAVPSGPSYANAAGATKKLGSTPLIATGSNPPPVVVGSSAPTSQHVKNSSVSPANGRPSIPPAVPTVVGAPPAVVHGSSLNGGIDHSRKSSVTIPNGPNSHFGNGGPVGASKTNIRFGGFESPAVAHSTPQAPGSTPIPIPAGNPRIASPAHSPAPIPQPSASGGRPPSGLQQPTSQMIFGSPSGDSDRHMRQPSLTPANPSLAAQSHIRKESTHSMHSDMGNPGMPGPGPGRGGYQQGGRGRGGFNPHNQPFNGHMGYPPQNFRNGPGQGRAIPPAFQPGRGQIPPYGPNSPQPARASPALAPSIPGTPNMGAASMQPQMPPGPMPSYHYAPPVPQAGFGYPPPFGDYGRPMPMSAMPGYQMPYMQQQGVPAYQAQFAPSPYQPHGPGPQNMSRTPSQSERPNSSTGQQNQPVIVSGTVQGAGQKSSNFARAKSSAITIKNEKGETINFSNINAPASPAPSIQQSRTPPVIASTPTPPPKPSTPAHVRTDSQAATKTAKEIQDEMREKVMQKAKEDKAKEDEAAAKAAEAEAKAKAAAEAEAARKKAEEEAQAARDAEAAAEAKRKEEEAEKKRLEEEELERQILEMEAEEARREEEERKFNEQRKIRDEEAKKKKEAERLANAAEEDRRLREQEAEMERLEEEKERRRKEADATGKTLSFQDALAAAKSGAVPTPEATPVVTVTDKMASLSITADSKPSTPTDASAQKTPTDKQRGPKPPALNLDRLTSKPVEPPPPSAALQSLRSARFLSVMGQDIYPAGISSPNPALNSAVTKKGKTFKYDANFLLQFQKVFTEQPSVEFHQQVKSLIGDTDGPRSAKPQSGSGRQNSRPGASTFSSMGSFAQAAPGGRTLPPGTTSADRFNMSSGNMARPNVPTMGSFPATRGGFPAPMARTPSSHNMAHAPGSPRVGSKRGSRRPNDAAKEAQAAKAMPLTANIDIEPIKISSTGWKPSSIGNRPGQSQSGMGGSNLMDPEMVQRKVKAALNKMTPEKFDKIADQILEIAAQSKHEVDGRTLRQVIQLTFEKATDEAHWASMYAKFCKRMLETMSSEIRDESIKDKAGNVVSGGALFRKYLLNRCQEEFERGWKANLPPEPDSKDDKKTLEAAMLSDEYYIAAAAKRRGLGLVQFIGELYKLGMLTERIMHECVKKLLDYSGLPDEAEIESLSKLLRTIGASLDATDKGRPMMDVYFARIQGMMDLPELPSRLKFMLMDVIDLRRVNWVSKEQNKGPKTLEEVRAEAEAAAAQKAAEAARSNQRGGPGRPQMGRGDARQFSSQFNQPQSNQVGMDDLRRLKGSASRTASQNVTLGPTSMFASRSNSGRRLGPGGSLSRGGDDSGPASRTGTPPTQSSHSNAFSLLANMETENPASPPSTAASPSLSKVVPDSSTGDVKKGE